MIEQREQLINYVNAGNSMADLFRSIRKEMGLSRAKFGEMLEVSGHFIYLIETDRRLPSLWTVQRLVKKVNEFCIS